MSGKEPAREGVTELLAALRRGDRSAMDRLMPLVYTELRRHARRQLGRDAVLSTTSLVHEAYLRLAHTPNADWQDRNHFFAVAVKAMRSVVVDCARRHLTKKRGGGDRPIELEEGIVRVQQDAAEILAIHEALDRLAALDDRMAYLVELRFFGGFSLKESADVLGVSERTVKRDWTKARTLLFQMVQERAT